MRLSFIDRIRQLDHLIQIKGTGNPDELASRLGISRRCLYDYINAMKNEGAPIEYDYFRKSYVYKEEGRFNIDFSFTTSQITKNIRSVAGYSSMVFISDFLMQSL